MAALLGLAVQGVLRLVTGSILWRLPCCLLYTSPESSLPHKLLPGPRVLLLLWHLQPQCPRVNVPGDIVALESVCIRPVVPGTLHSLAYLGDHSISKHILGSQVVADLLS